MTHFNAIGRAMAACAALSCFTFSAMAEDEPRLYDGQPFVAGEEPALATAAASLPATSVSDLTILLYHTDRIGQRDGVIAGLVGTGLFGVLDIETAYLDDTVPPLGERGPLSPAELTAYDCIIVWTGFNDYPAAQRGDELADYVDDGGGVVLAYGALSNTSIPNFSIQGRLASPTYSPLDSTNTLLPSGSRSLDMPTANVLHPVLQGVGAFTYTPVDGAAAVATLDPGATLIASDTAGSPLIAVSAAEDIVAFNAPIRPDRLPANPANEYRAFANACDFVAVREVEIDIKPGSMENSINLASGGVTPVAIFGSEIIDVAEIDTSSLRLADSSVKVVGKKNNELCSVDDMDIDGYDDLVCKFNTMDLGALDGSSVEVNLSGQLFSGRKFRGSEVVNTVN